MKYSTFLAAIALALIFAPDQAGAIDFPHDYTNFPNGCAHCHSLHNGTAETPMFSPIFPDVNSMCESCHFVGGPAPEVDTHTSDSTNEDFTFATDCNDCHDPHLQRQYLFPERSGCLIRSAVRKPDDSFSTIVLSCSCGINSFADGDGVADGICEVCHTQTTHHTDIGTDLSHFTSADCIICHPHTDSDYGYGFRPGDLDEQTHSTHITEPRGPRMTCSSGAAGCHGAESPPLLADGLDLDNTGVCDECHSPGGYYDGVDDAMIGAKTNWGSEVYEFDQLKSGRGKWCAGCHDDAPGNSQMDGLGVNAPNVIGFEDAAYPYGYGWGYYKTGHGLESGLYPATGAPAAGIGCLACHDYTASHIDGDHRTYSASATEPGHTYREGYRLQEVDGGEPMDIPRAGFNNPPADFALCVACHDSDLYLITTNFKTNFRDGPAARNSHAYHLSAGGAFVGRWDSDWDGAVLDSRPSCPACHNVHGSPSPAMTRHGELMSSPGTTDKVSSINLRYTPNSAGYPTLSESTGGAPRYIGVGPGTVTKNGICFMCHADNNGYMRNPSDLYPPSILAVYGSIGGNQLIVTFSEPVSSTTSGDYNLIAGDFLLTDIDNSRTITGVSHSSGDMAAFLTISSALDSVDDLDFDTISAATSFSIQDAAQHPNMMEVTPVLISGDGAPPEASLLVPADLEVDVLQTSDLSLRLTDEGIGLDLSTLSITISGDLGYFRSYSSSGTEVTLTGPLSSMNVRINPDANFGAGEVITVSIAIDDLAGNSLSSPAWSFTTVSTPVWLSPDFEVDSVCLTDAAALIDADLATGNGFGPCGPDHYGSFRLDADGGQYHITEVRFYGGPAITANWRVLVSNDAVGYTQADTFSAGGAGQWYEYTLSAPQDARYMRINNWHGGPQAPESLFEFEFKGILN